MANKRGNIKSWWLQQPASEVAKRDTLQQLLNVLTRDIEELIEYLDRGPQQIRIDNPCSLRLTFSTEAELHGAIKAIKKLLAETKPTLRAGPPENVPFDLVLPPPSKTPAPVSRRHSDRMHVFSKLIYRGVGNAWFLGSFDNPVAAQAILGPLIDAADENQTTMRGGDGQAPMWTLMEAILYLRALSPKLRAVGFDCGLHGSVLQRGDSFKDLDITVYPLRTDTADTALMSQTLKDFGLSLKTPVDVVQAFWKSQHKSFDTKAVSVWTTSDGRRVDVFFLK